MRKRVIVFGVKTFPSQGGTDRVGENLICQLREQFQITLYCYRNPHAKKHIHGIEVIEFPRPGKGALGTFVYMLMSALHILFTQRADLVHVHKTDAALFIPLLRTRFPVVATSHEAPYKRDKWNPLMKLYFRLAERIFVSTANVCSCISKPLAEYYNRKYDKEVIFIPNGINPLSADSFDYTGALTFLPEGASLQRPFILFSARRIMKTKGCHTMLEALANIGYSGQVFIAGEPTHNPGYLERLRQIGKSLNMYFLGFVHPLPTLLAFVQAAELFVFPSETEGMSIMLLEVASAGRPMVVSDIPENTQVFTEQEVLFFKVSDAGDLAVKIKSALSDKDRMKELGVKCQQKVYTEYVWSKIATAYADVYRTVMRQP